MSIRDTHDLKALKTRLAKAESDADAAKEEAKLAQKRESQYRALASELREKVAAFGTKKEPTVTEHALLRYIERVMGVDLELLKREMLTDQAKAIIQQLPNGKVPGNGCRLVVKDGVIVTVEPL